MNKRSQHSVVGSLGKLARLAVPLAGLALLVGASAFAARHPTPLLVTQQTATDLATHADTAADLKVVTYNIWGLPSWMTGARGGRYSRIAAEIERLNPDIVLLQEAWTAKARKSAPTDGHWAIARAAGQHCFFQQCGLLTMSRFPIVGGQFYPFRLSSFPDKFVNKGVLKVTIRLPSGQVANVWNVHLQDGGKPVVRSSQVRELLAHVEAAEDGQTLDLIGGDFNCTPESALYQELVRSLGPSAQPAGGARPFVTWDGLSVKPGAGETLDYVFIRPHITLGDVRAETQVAFAAPNPTDRLSDHFGIQATVHLLPTLDVARGSAAPPASSLVSAGGGAGRGIYAASQ